MMFVLRALSPRGGVQSARQGKLYCSSYHSHSR